MSGTMIKEFRLPDLGEGLTESEILSWKVGVGDTVSLNQVIAEVETAKAVVELPSPFAGVIKELHEQPGTIVEVGKPIVSFEVADDAGTASAPAVAPVSSPAGQEREREQERSRHQPNGNRTWWGTAPSSKVPASPCGANATLPWWLSLSKPSLSKPVPRWLSMSKPGLSKPITSKPGPGQPLRSGSSPGTWESTSPWCPAQARKG
jgi:2-oxoisovalerate dehydrogenase E2 component (dihydrolipoyl transacylase)